VLPRDERAERAVSVASRDNDAVLITRIHYRLLARAASIRPRCSRVRSLGRGNAPRSRSRRRKMSRSESRERSWERERERDLARATRTRSNVVSAPSTLQGVVFGSRLITRLGLCALRTSGRDLVQRLPIYLDRRLIANEKRETRNEISQNRPRVEIARTSSDIATVDQGERCIIFYRVGSNSKVRIYIRSYFNATCLMLHIEND